MTGGRPDTTISPGGWSRPASEPVVSPARLPHSPVPLPLTSFIGREQEVAAVVQALASPAQGTRLLTLTGPGGCGKTRLALAVATSLLSVFPDGVYWVDLSVVADPSLVPYAVAASLGVCEGATRPDLATLAAALADHRVLLVLDNCEHLVDICALVVRTLLLACPGLRILVTSQVTLQVDGEVIRRVPSLSVPPDQVLTVDEVLAYEAVRLFVDRAQAVATDFAVTTEMVPPLVQLCRRLDGIPLALELAATRLRVLTIEQIVQRLDDRFRLLVGQSRTAPPRHRTLRAMLDWSIELLTLEEQRLFRQLSIFVGDFSLEAVEVVCTGDGSPVTDVLDTLTVLVDRSLVQVEQRPSSMTLTARYRLLETVRQFGRDRLVEAGEEARLRQQHCDWCVALVEQAAPEAAGQDQKKRLDQLEVEVDNFRAALAWCLENTAGAATGLRLATGLVWFWLARDRCGEGLTWLERVLVRFGAERSIAQARALIGACRLTWCQGSLERSIAFGEEGLALYRELADRRGTAHALVALALALDDNGEATRARELLHESIDLAQAMGEKHILADALNHLGRLAAHQGEYDTARQVLEPCLVLAREIGDRRRVATALSFLGFVALRQGNASLAEAYQQESLAIKRELRLRRMSAFSLVNLGLVCRWRGDFPAAGALFDESLTILHRSGDQRSLAWAIENLAGLAVAEGQLQRAARLFGAVAMLRESIGAPVLPAFRVEYEHDIALVQAGLDEATLSRIWAESQTLSLEHVIAEARAVTGSGLRAEQPVAVLPTPTATIVATDEPGEATSTESSGPLAKLTPRELAVLRLLATGRSSQEIAAELGLSVRTVERHITNLYHKLGVHNRAGATILALQQGLV